MLADFSYPVSAKSRSERNILKINLTGGIIDLKILINKKIIISHYYDTICISIVTEIFQLHSSDKVFILRNN